LLEGPYIRVDGVIGFTELCNAGCLVHHTPCGAIPHTTRAESIPLYSNTIQQAIFLTEVLQTANVKIKRS